MTVLKRSLVMFAFFCAFALSAQSPSKKPIPSSKTLEKATEVIDTSNAVKDTVAPAKREEPPRTINVTNTESGGSTGGTTNTSSSSEPIEVTEKVGGDGVSDDSASRPALYVNFKTIFELIPSDDLSTVDYVEYKINDSDYIRYTGPIQLSREGSTTIAYRSVDRVGNKENPSMIFLVVDNTPPVCTLRPSESLYFQKGAGYASTKNSYTITAEDFSSGVRDIMYSVDNGERMKYSGPIKLESNGFHSINYYGVDNANNTGVEMSYAVNVDDVKPSIEIVESLPFVKVGDKLFARRGTKFKLVARDAESGIAKILYKKPGINEFTAYVEDLAFDSSGEQTIEAKAIDNVGNESEIKKITFYYDIQAPKTTIKATPANN